MGFGWLLHPDAEGELRRLGESAGASYEPRRTTHRLARNLKTRFSSLTADDVSLLPSELATFPRQDGITWLPWCPTPYLARLANKHLGLRSRFPKPELLYRLNDKAYLQKYRSWTAPNRMLLLQRAQLDENLVLSERPPLSVGQGGPARFRLKQRFGQAGRGQRRINARLSPDDMRFVEDSLRKGGLILEPELDLTLNCSLHGVIGDDGILLGKLVPFRIDRFQAPQQGIAHLGLPDVPLLTDSAPRLGRQVAEDLRAEGYRGPFGLDLAYTTSGELYLLDLNARFTLHWSQGMAENRSLALGLLPNYFSTR